MLPDANPITLTYRAFHAALLAWEPWASLVRVRNFPDMTGEKYSGFDPASLPADFPHVALMQGQFTLMPCGRNSRVTSVDQSYPLVMAMDTVKLLDGNQLKWETMRALVKAQPTLDALGFLRTYDIVQGTDYPSGQEPWARGENRLVMALQINAQIDVDRRTLLAQ